MRIACKEQRTAEWLSVRTGKIGASNIDRAMSFLKRASGAKKAGDSSGDRDRFILELATELITRVPSDHYISKPMEIGMQFEGEARTEYWMATGQEVDETGFVLHPTLDYLGASPDGLCLPTHGIEIKVPLLHTHMGYLKDHVVPEEYIPQMQCNMLCCELPAWDFVSYCPAEVYPQIPDRFRLFIKRLPADPELHRQMEEAATRTMEEATALVGSLIAQYPEREPREIPTTLKAHLDGEYGLSDEDIAWAQRGFTNAL
jgi:hypothetical protein